MADFTKEEIQAEAARRAAVASGSEFTPEEIAAEKNRRRGGEVIEEMHPAFTAMDRFQVKNFANDPEAAKAFLQKKYPQLEIKTDDNSGKIIARGEGEKAFRVLDPDTGFFSNPAEMLRDAGDIATDVGTGVATTAATAGAGLLAGATSFGAGAVPAAMAAGAGSSAGLEALRQKIGVGLGINNEVNTDDVLWAGGAGAVSPLLFGTGATATQVALKGGGKTLAAMNPFAGAGTALKEGFTTAADSVAGKGLLGGGKAAVGGFLRGTAREPALDEAGKAVLLNQRGLVGRGYDSYRQNVAPWLGSMGSGKNLDDIIHYRDNNATVDALNGVDMGQLGEDIRESTAGSFKANKKSAGTLMNDVREATENVDISGARAAFREAIDAEKAKIGPELATGKQFKDRIDAMELEYRNMFQMEVPSEAAERLVEIENKIDEFGPEYLTDDVQGMIDEFKAQPQTKWVDMPDNMSGDQAWIIQQRAKNLSGVERHIRAGTYANSPLSQTEAKRSLQFAAGDASQALQEAINLASDGAMDKASARYADVSKAKKILKRVIGDNVTDATVRKMANLTNAENVEQLAALAEVDRILGTKLVKQAKDLAANKAFGKNAEYFATSGRGVTATLRGIPAAAIGGSLGYYLGANTIPGQGGAGLGLAAGTVLGAGLGGARGLKAYMAMQRGATTLGKAAANVGVKAPVVPFSAWSMMNNAGTGQ